LSTVSITEKDDGRSIEADLNDIVSVTLPENPTTGFRWAVDSPGYSSLELLRDDYTSSGTPKPGAATLRIMEFKPKTRGNFELKLKMVRAWESGGSGTSTFTLKLRIK
jgi:inhibitor of cysteine peptidase